jgi:hypothetical protein
MSKKLEQGVPNHTKQPTEVKLNSESQRLKPPDVVTLCVSLYAMSHLEAGNPMSQEALVIAAAPAKYSTDDLPKKPDTHVEQR